MEKLLIISSSRDRNQSFLNLLEELSVRNKKYFLFSDHSYLSQYFLEKGWAKKKAFFGPEIKNFKKVSLFLILLPWLWLRMTFFLAYAKINKKIRTIVCEDIREKLIFTRPASLLGYKVIWLERPDAFLLNIPKPLLWFYKRGARKAILVTANNFSKTKFNNLGIKEEKIFVLPPSIKPNQYQDNIFNKMAHAEQRSFHKKFFTIGTIADLNQKQKIEAIMQSVKMCLAVIPNLQLIIIGEGEERKSLSWLAKKMEIDNLVWFVGSQAHFKKWLESFDLFIVSSNPIKFEDYNAILEAMSAGLPVIGPWGCGLEDIIYENKTGSLIEIDNCEMLSRQIIKLQQDRRLCLQLGKNSRERVENYFTIQNSASQFEKILTV